MDETAVGGLLGLLLFVAAVAYGGLMLSSHAVLFSETPTQSGIYTGFKCSYFTGTRVFETYTNGISGCARFVKVGP